MAHVHAMESARSRGRTIAVREDNSLAFIERDRFTARLRARPLLDEQKFAAFEITTTPAERAGELERERDLAIQILMQAVVSAGFVAKDERRLLGLPARRADLQERRQRIRIRVASAKLPCPPVRMGGQLRVEIGPELFDDLRHRAREVLV